MQILLKEIDAKKKKLQELLKNPDNAKELNKWLITELAYTSNAIEGNTLTRQETELVIEEDITSGSKPLNDYLEAKNHADVYNFMLDSIKENIPADEKLILQIHKMILKAIDDMNAGFYRSVKVRISGSQTILPNPLNVPNLMDELNNWLIETNDDVMIKAVEAHYRLVTIHPFADGNGRTARLLMNYILLKAGYSPIIIRNRDRKRYLRVLENRQVKGLVEPYQKFMLESLKRSMGVAIDLLDIETVDVSGEKLMKIGEFAKFVNLPVSTIRYWVEVGKIKPVAKTQSDYMLFAEYQSEEVDKLKS